MPDTDLLILRGGEVSRLLAGREAEIIDAVRRAYVAHGRGDSHLPHSTYLKLPHDEKDRVFALPAYLGSEFDVAGIKWIASVPRNIEHGMERASATVILNSTLTGRPQSIIEGSVISAKRTAASAALAARHLLPGGEAEAACLVGCGLINFEIARFLLASFPGLRRLIVHDLSASRAASFVERCRRAWPGVEVCPAADLASALGGLALISFATTALEPHFSELSACAAGGVILHISLRDLTPEAIISCENVVDDVDHVCRARTSLHLAEQLCGSRDFVRCTLADVLTGAAPAKSDPGTLTVFSPFGLGVLDLAVAQRVDELAREHEMGTTLSSFLPPPWDTDAAVPLAATP